MTEHDAIRTYDASPISMPEDEHKRGLLQEWKDHLDERPGVTGKAWSMCSAAVFISAIITFLAALVVVGSAMLGLGSQSQDVMASSNAVLNNDYVLDPAWNFDAAPKRRVFKWTIKDQEHNPDGIYRPMILVNNQYPGPLIEVNEGDTVVVEVDNQATNATSIHWHGLYQQPTPYFDGTVGVTQCPIAPDTRHCHLPHRFRANYYSQAVPLRMSSRSSAKVGHTGGECAKWKDIGGGDHC